jgi:hypothetical protein
MTTNSSSSMMFAAAAMTSAITAFGGTLYVGGSFTQANGPANRAGFAQYTDPIQYAHGSMGAATATSVLSGQVNEAPARLPIKGVSASGTTIVLCEGAGCHSPATRLRFELNRATTVRLVLRTRVHGQLKQVATSTLRGHPGVNRVRVTGRWHGHLAAAAGPVQILVQTHRDGHWSTATTVPRTVRHTHRRG